MCRMTKLLASIVIVLTVLPGFEIQAQNQGGFRGGRDANLQIDRTMQMDMGLALLLKNQRLQKELDLTEIGRAHV
jgi:hypothetical protein